jgi:hypothetical protein
VPRTAAALRPSPAFPHGKAALNCCDSFKLLKDSEHSLGLMVKVLEKSLDVPAVEHQLQHKMSTNIGEV